jgi:hypothetical protein
MSVVPGWFAYKLTQFPNDKCNIRSRKYYCEYNTPNALLELYNIDWLVVSYYRSKVVIVISWDSFLLI